MATDQVQSESSGVLEAIPAKRARQENSDNEKESDESSQGGSPVHHPVNGATRDGKTVITGQDAEKK